MTDDAVSGSQTPPEPRPPAGPPGSPAGPAAEDTRPGEGVTAGAGHRDIAIDATGYVLSTDTVPAPGGRARRPLGRNELSITHTPCGGWVTRVGPGDDASMILDEITGHDVACPHVSDG